MPKAHRDAIQVVKSFLRRSELRSPERSDLAALASELRVIEDRLARAKHLEARVDLSETLRVMLAATQNPMA